MNMLRMSEGSTKMLGLHLPTWRVNPELPEDSELFKEESRKDHQAMMTNYGAQPPVVGNPFFNVPDRVIKSQRSKGYNYVKHRPYSFKVAKGISERSSEILTIKECGYACVAAIDAGYSDNSFALAVGAMKDDGIVHVDLLVEVQPMPNVVLNYTRIFDEVIIPVCRARNVRVLLADQWQSIKLLQDARDLLELGAADRHSLKYTDMVDAKNAINSGSMLIPKARTEIKTLKDLLAYDDSDYPACFAGNEVEHLLLQMCTVQDTGRAVLKGDGITDDLWRAVALLHWGATEDKYAEFLTKEEEVQEQVRPQFKAAMATGSKSRTFNGSIQQGKFIAVKAARK